MKIFIIKPKSLPLIGFAHSFTAHSDYVDTFPVTHCYLEISYQITQFVKQVYEDGTTEIVPPGSIHVDLRNCVEHVYVPKNHSHATVSLCLQYDYEEIEDFNEEKLKDLINVPDLIMPSHCVLENGEKIKNQISEIVEEYTVHPKNVVKLSNMVLSLLLEIDLQFRRTFYGKYYSSGEFRYVERAKRYIAEHISEKIYVKDISDNIDISIGYLSSLFKEATGQSLVEYIQKSKLEKVAELVNKRGLSVKNAAFSLGYTDENYVSRIYKKYFGKNIKR